MKKVIVPVFIICFLLSFPGPAISGSDSNSDDWTPDYWTGNVNVFIGVKALDEGDWEPVDMHDQIGVLADFRKKSWPISVAVDFLVSWDDQGAISLPGIGTVGLEAEAKTRELDLGVRKIWDYSPNMHPYFGGGIGLVWAELEGRTTGNRVSDDDTGIGLWIGAGIYWTLYNHFNLGADFRWSKAEVTLHGVDQDAGGYHAGVSLGYHW